MICLPKHANYASVSFLRLKYYATCIFPLQRETAKKSTEIKTVAEKAKRDILVLYFATVLVQIIF